MRSGARLKAIEEVNKLQAIAYARAKAKPGEVLVESGIPVPSASGHVNRGYPWRTMAVGDSFFVPATNSNSLTSVSRANKTYAPKRFLSRRLESDEVYGAPGWRVWRVA